MKLQKKVIAYVTYNAKILVFSHVAFPEAGIQIPKGTVEPHEELELAVLREVREETGLSKIRVEKYLGKDEIVVSHPITKESEKLDCFFYHIISDEFREESWIWLEKDPNPSELLPEDVEELTNYGGIRLKLFWVDFHEIPHLMGTLGKFLNKLSF